VNVRQSCSLPLFTIIMVESEDVLPTISLGNSATAESLAKPLLDACSGPGFFYLADHGLSDSDIESMFQFSEGFFTDQEEEKLKYRREGNVGNVVSHYLNLNFPVEIR
jgi:isopenicillin N synthase-like dioxygenase